jgi:hypothetical protein
VNEERREKINRMRSAIRKGRDERKEELDQVGFRVEYATDEFDRLPKYQRQLDYTEEINYAHGRDMLAKEVFEGRDGKPVTLLLSQGKMSEPYNKRPSVRAYKKSRGNSP